MKKEYIEEQVDLAYAKLEALPGFVKRPQQVTFSKAVAWVLSSNPNEKNSLVVEAPTGVGKTIGYLIGAIVASSLRVLPPIYVATATKLLQEQIVNSDLSRLLTAGVISSPKGIVISKGASNYLCLKRLNGLIPLREEAETDPSVPLSADELDLTPDYLSAVLDSFNEKTWNGDFDHLNVKGFPQKKTYPIAVNPQTCQGRQCEHASRCPYMLKKAEAESASIVIASHDLVLSLARMLKGSQGSVLMDRFVFDEAHNLPEKAINQGCLEARLSEFRDAYRVLAALKKNVERDHPAAEFASLPVDTEGVYAAIKDLENYLGAIDYDEETEQHRFPRANVPDPIKAGCREILRIVSPLTVQLSGILKEPSLTAVLSKTALHEAENAFFALMDGLEVFSRYAAAKAGAVYWVSKLGAGFRLSLSPLDSSEILSNLLWQNPEGYSAVFVSATLRTTSGFGPFVQKLGLPKKPAVRAMDHVFDYGKSSLEVVPMRHTPKLHERGEFTKEFVLRVLLSLKEEAVSALVLVPSWRFLRDVSEPLRSKLPAGSLKIQGEAPLKELLELHKRDTDKGRPSYLLGTMSLAEGLDLPGKYCEHVHIATIPFPVPSSPFDKELSDVLGNAYFSEHSLPSATTKLRQMVGRLVRSESDKGKISLYDKRLGTTSYGKLILDTLPPFGVVQH